MTTLEKKELLNELNISMGNVSTEVKTFHHKYDESTGTYYCGGMAITESTMEQAKSYFQKLMLQCNNSEVREVRNVAIFYRLAIDAISEIKERSNWRWKR